MTMHPEATPTPPRCGAKTRTGRPCALPAMTGAARCRMHGTGGGAPKGNGNALKTGDFTQAAMAERQALRALDARLAELEDVRQQEGEAATAAALAERIAAQREQVAEHRAKIQGEEAIDAATWVQMEREMRQLAQALDGVVWEARLAALLGGI